MQRVWNAIYYVISGCALSADRPSLFCPRWGHALGKITSNGHCVWWPHMLPQRERYVRRPQPSAQSSYNTVDTTGSTSTAAPPIAPSLVSGTSEKQLEH